jgi:hypothetical protein
MVRKICRGKPSDNRVTLLGFYPNCPSCEVAPVVDGWCHHIDCNRGEGYDDEELCVIKPDRPYCGLIIKYHHCPLSESDC